MANSNQRVQIKRGTKSTKPTTGTLNGELHLTTDSLNLYTGNASGSLSPITPPVADLTNITAPSVDLNNDLLMLTDVSETGQQEKNIKIVDLKTALNIPPASSDEKVATASGKTAGYLSDIIDNTATNHIEAIYTTLRVPDGKVTFDIKNGAIYAEQLAGDTSHTPMANGNSGNLLMSKGDGSFDWSTIIDCGTW